IGSNTKLSVVARRSSGTAVAKIANTIEIAVAVAAPRKTAPTVSQTKFGANASSARLAAASTQAPARSGRKPKRSPAVPASGERSAPSKAENAEDDQSHATRHRQAQGVKREPRR